MTELIKIEQKNGVETVNARDLHEYLDSKYRFSDWIKKRIDKYGFYETHDFIKVSEKIDTLGGTQIGISYYISIDMAKELSMVENNEKGREARQYFIFMEKRAKQAVTHQLTEDEIIYNALQIQQKKIVTLSLKAQVAERLADTEGLYLPSIAGRLVTGNPNIFCQWLVDRKLMFRKAGKLIPYARYGNYFQMKVSILSDEESVFQSYFTPRGLAWVQARYLKENTFKPLDLSGVPA